MFNSIDRIKGLGVYGDYAPPAGTKEFSSSNVIYGWNYSGKTTLSRLFAHVERGGFEPESAGYTFSLATDSGQVTEANAKDCGQVVRVFNSDFVQENLNFGSAHGRPILLLGSESEAAQKEIAEIVAIRARVNQAVAKQQHNANGAESRLAEAKKAAAAATKAALSLVDTYTATQLDIDLRITQLGLESKLSDEALAAATKLARTPDEEALPPVESVRVATDIADLWAKAAALLPEIPKVAGAIARLAEQPEIATWVETGLKLHEHSENCEFCGNALAAKRLEDLRSHFSTAQAEFKARVESLLSRAKAARLSPAATSSRDVYPQFRERLDAGVAALTAAAQVHNDLTEKLEGALAAKLAAPFSPAALAALLQDPAVELLEAASVLNAAIAEHNAVANDFKSRKAEAIKNARRHYAQSFDETQRLDDHARMQERYKARVAKIREMGGRLDARRNELEAQINKAQKGRKEINARIESLLGAECVQIEVTKVAGDDRFKLVRRDGSVAKQLSEGEKTAVGFAFFLTKLRELSDLSKAIVFLDDPISSLDSNHIFQVAAILREVFFEKENNAWKTKCKQVFFSTHNFEFLSLLRDLPMGDNKNKSSYYLIHRRAPGQSAMIDMPLAIMKHSSEYHFLFSVIDKFHKSADKTDLEVLMHLPNAVRRFVELYTYAKYPAGTVDQRAEKLFGVEKGRRILKVLHHFSHGNNVERLARNNDCMADIEAAVDDLMKLIAERDQPHLEALQST